MPAQTVFILLLVVGAAAAFVFARRFQTPKPKMRHLAMITWAAFGPYKGPDDAEGNLRRSVRAVFGPEEAADQDDWISAHARNFRDWQAEGRFAQAEEFARRGLLASAQGPHFEEACRKVRELAIADATQAMKHLNKEFLEGGGQRLEAVKRPDGEVDIIYKRIWSDEQINRKKAEDDEAILNAIGSHLLSDQSVQARQLLSFLKLIFHADSGRQLETPAEVGLVWLSCWEIQNKDADPDVARTFKSLQDAWLATRPGNDG